MAVAVAVRNGTMKSMRMVRRIRGGGATTTTSRHARRNGFGVEGRWLVVEEEPRVLEPPTTTTPTPTPTGRPVAPTGATAFDPNVVEDTGRGRGVGPGNGCGRSHEQPVRGAEVGGVV